MSQTSRGNFLVFRGFLRAAQALCTTVRVRKDEQGRDWRWNVPRRQTFLGVYLGAIFPDAERPKPSLCRMNSFLEQRQQLMVRKRELDASLSKPVLSEAEQKEQLLQQVKDDNAHTATFVRNIGDAEKRIAQIQKVGGTHHGPTPPRDDKFKAPGTMRSAPRMH